MSAKQGRVALWDQERAQILEQFGTLAEGYKILRSGSSPLTPELAGAIVAGVAASMFGYPEFVELEVDPE